MAEAIGTKIREYKSGNTPETGTLAKGEYFDAEFNLLYHNDAYLDDNKVDRAGDVITGDFTVNGVTRLKGGVIIEGPAAKVETIDSEITDNIVTLNKGETGNGVTKGTAGIEVDRGTGEKAQVLFREDIDAWVAGTETDLQKVIRQQEFDTHKNTDVAHGAVSAPTALKMVARDASGRAQFATPAAAQDAATKNYVDTHAALQTAHGAVSAPTASKMVVRDTSGRAQFADPAAAQDAATMGYVDSHANLQTAHDAVSAPTASKMVVRDGSGRAQFADPSTAQDAATKNYADTHANLQTAHGAVSTPTASKMVVRDTSGRAQFADPASAQDAATKNYADTHANLQAAHGAVSAPTASKMVVRDTSGRAQFANPAAAQDVATKNYADTHANLQTAHGAVSAPTASKMVVRDASGRAQFANPATAQDASTKNYVDTLLAIKGFLAKNLMSVDGSYRRCIFNGEELDIGAGYNTSTGIYTVPTAGYYIFNANVNISTGSGNIVILKNGSRIAAQGSTLQCGVSVSAICFCNVGDTICLYLEPNMELILNDSTANFSGIRIPFA